MVAHDRERLGDLIGSRGSIHSLIFEPDIFGLLMLTTNHQRFRETRPVFGIPFAAPKKGLHRTVRNMEFLNVVLDHGTIHRQFFESTQLRTPPLFILFTFREHRPRIKLRFGIDEYDRLVTPMNGAPSLRRALGKRFLRDRIYQPVRTRR